ncbi:inner membrane protein YhjD [Candidatus Mycolicibacterium alkanivorans]|uniref:Inner membrane protein YhjD n=1 Tax=Candidatus Mycolicibacterium alkanivorans TaxID=2954114 RepID=A0ABS9Z077_9MYCO|nr:inner membrane protein YhjD [Candidatus Mycolicibacterium alkanivorans]MCI4676889.1 inner membrane protein YhjD [Candidatus Mycolicibacterium alkanivorans]
MTEPAKPGILDRFRARYHWFDHVMRAAGRYQNSKGDFYAAGITYYTIFALFPLLMVGFAAAGFVLASQPHLLADIESRIKATFSGSLGQQLIGLMDSAINSRTSVGVIGLAAAAWAGLGWIANLREALSQMWDQRTDPKNFVRTKIADLLVLLSTFVAITVTLVLGALADPSLMERILEWGGVPHATGLGGVLRAASLLMSWLVSWLLFTWMIARLPREAISFRSSVRAGLLAAVGFVIFKQVAGIYLRSVVHGPAGATFGPVLGLMVFAYITARLLLFATAWAATSAENQRPEPVPAPAPAVINPRVGPDEGLRTRQWVAAMVVGAFGALGVSRLWRSSR